MRSWELCLSSSIWFWRDGYVCVGSGVDQRIMVYCWCCPANAVWDDRSVVGAQMRRERRSSLVVLWQDDLAVKCLMSVSSRKALSRGLSLRTLRSAAEGIRERSETSVFFSAGNFSGTRQAAKCVGSRGSCAERRGKDPARPRAGHMTHSSATAHVCQPREHVPGSCQKCPKTVSSGKLPLTPKPHQRGDRAG